MALAASAEPFSVLLSPSNYMTKAEKHPYGDVPLLAHLYLYLITYPMIASDSADHKDNMLFTDFSS